MSVSSAHVRAPPWRSSVGDRSRSTRCRLHPTARAASRDWPFGVAGDGRARYSPKAFSCGATDIPRKPNYDFERREREKNKAAEAAKKAQAKADKKAAQQGTPSAD
jgi:hypothetical protein